MLGDGSTINASMTHASADNQSSLTIGGSMPLTTSCTPCFSVLAKCLQPENKVTADTGSVSYTASRRAARVYW